MATNVLDEISTQPSTGSLNGGTVRGAGKVTTTDATATVIYSTPAVAVGEAIIVKASVIGKKSDGTAAAVNFVWGGFRRQSAGNITLVGALTGTAQEDSAGTPVITIAVNTTAQTAEVKVTGIAAETWLWEAMVEYCKV